MFLYLYRALKFISKDISYNSQNMATTVQLSWMAVMYFTPRLVEICMYSANFTTVDMWNLAILTSDHCMKYQTPRLKRVLHDLYTCTSIYKLVLEFNVDYAYKS